MYAMARAGLQVPRVGCTQHEARRVAPGPVRPSPRECRRKGGAKPKSANRWSTNFTSFTSWPGVGPARMNDQLPKSWNTYHSKAVMTTLQS